MHDVLVWVKQFDHTVVVSAPGGVVIAGAIARVAGDPIGTQFVIAGPLVLPLRSLFVSTSATERAKRDPKNDLAQHLAHAEAVEGLSLRRLSWRSVAHGYLRILGVFAFGLLVVVAAVMVRGPESWRTPEAFIVVASLSALVGVTVGLSYFFGKHVAPRDLVIRTACARVFGIAADPALVMLADARRLAETLDAILAARGVSWDALLRSYAPPSPESHAYVLLRVRAALALDPADAHRLEELTDGLVVDAPAVTNAAEPVHPWR